MPRILPVPTTPPVSATVFRARRGVSRVWAAVLLAPLLLAGCAVAPDRGGDPFISTSSDSSTQDGVRRRFTICYNPFADPSYRAVIDRLVYEQCGRHVEPVNESAARCTLFHPSTLVFACRLGGESQEPKEKRDNSSDPKDPDKKDKKDKQEKTR